MPKRKVSKERFRNKPAPEYWANEPEQFIYQKGSKMVTFKNKFTKIFSDACKMVCIYEKYRTTFHSLRHTFAVLMYYETRDIHDVFKALHHGRIETTLIYMDYSAKRIEKEFPSLVKKNGDDTRKVGTHSNNYVHPPL